MDPQGRVGAREVILGNLPSARRRNVVRAFNLHPAGLVLLDQTESQSRLGRRLDGRTADLAVALGGVSVAAAEEGTGHLYRQVYRSPDAQVPGVDIASRERVCGKAVSEQLPYEAAEEVVVHGLTRRNRGELAVGCGGDAHDAQERTDGHRDAWFEDSARGPARARDGRLKMWVAQLPDLEVLSVGSSRGELVSQEAKAWEDGGPAIVAGHQREDLDLEEVTGPGVLDVDGPKGRVGEGKVKVLEGGGLVVWADLVVAAVEEVKGDFSAGWYG